MVDEYDMKIAKLESDLKDLEVDLAATSNGRLALALDAEIQEIKDAILYLLRERMENAKIS